MSSDPLADFHSKYERTNAITRRLLAGFFAGVEGVVRGLPAKSMLEVGCGAGFSTSHLRGMLAAGTSFEASDVDRSLVRAARERNPDVFVRQESIYALSRPDHSVDLVIVLEVLEHLDDPARAMQEVIRVARRWAVLSVPCEPLWRLLNMARLRYLSHLGNTPGHVQHWTPTAFRRFTGRYGRVRAVRLPPPWIVVLLELGESPS